MRQLDSPGGNTLVTCVEGEVSCEADKQTTLAVPGQVVEKRIGKALARRALEPGRLGEFRAAWLAEEEKAFHAAAPRAAKVLLLEYLAMEKKLEAATTQMARDEDLRAWAEQKRRNQGLKAENPQDLGKKVKDVGLRLARISFLLGAMERLEAKISALEASLDRQDRKIMGQMLRPRYTVGDFLPISRKCEG